MFPFRCKCCKSLLHFIFSSFYQLNFVIFMLKYYVGEKCRGKQERDGGKLDRGTDWLAALGSLQSNASKMIVSKLAAYFHFQ